MQHDKVDKSEVEKLVDQFPGQSIDFFGALRARVYDDRVRQFVLDTGIENIGKALVNAYAPCPCPVALCLTAELHSMLMLERSPDTEAHLLVAACMHSCRDLAFLAEDFPLVAALCKLAPVPSSNVGPSGQSSPPC